MVAMTEVFRVYLARGYFCPPTIKSAAKGKKVGLRNCVRGKKQNPSWRNPGTDGLFAIENMFRIVSHSIGFYLNITSNRIGRITFSSFHFFFF